VNKCLATKNGHDKIINKKKENCEAECNYFKECYSSEFNRKTYLKELSCFKKIYACIDCDRRSTCNERKKVLVTRNGVLSEGTLLTGNLFGFAWVEFKTLEDRAIFPVVKLTLVENAPVQTILTVKPNGS